MTNNISRIKKFMQCQKAAFNTYHRHLEGSRGFALTDGTAFHAGFAEWQSSGDWDKALEVAKSGFTNDVEAMGLDMVYDTESAAHWDLVEAMLNKAKYKWRELGMSIIQPECSFKVPIAGTEHNDITLHWYEVVHIEGMRSQYIQQWGIPNSEAILEKRVRTPHNKPDPSCPCYQPHYLMGRVDGILSKDGKIWLQEHKTTAMTGAAFSNQWELDFQLSGYCYAIWKALGLKPVGVVLNAIVKPSQSQVDNWSKGKKGTIDYIKFLPELYGRTDADLARFERDYTIWCDMWEYSILHGTFPMSPLAFHCQAYNRKCDYFDLCTNHDAQDYIDNMRSRKHDYVDEDRLTQIEGM